MVPFERVLNQVTSANYLWLLLCRTSSSHHSGYKPGRPRQWQHRVHRQKGMCHHSVDNNEHHMSAACTATWPVQGGCTCWKQWLPPDKVQWLWKFTLEILSQATIHLSHTNWKSVDSDASCQKCLFFLTCQKGVVWTFEFLKIRKDLKDCY